MILIQATCNYHFRHTQNGSLPIQWVHHLAALDSASPEVLEILLLAAPSCTCMVRGLNFSKLDFADPRKGQATSSEKAVHVLLCFCSPSGTSGVVTMAGTAVVLCGRQLSKNTFGQWELHLDDQLEPSGSTHRGYQPIFRAGQIRHLSPPSP